MLFSVLLFLYAAWPRTVKTLLNLVCGRLISARIKLTSTDVGELLSHSECRFPTLGVAVLAVVAF